MLRGICSSILRMPIFLLDFTFGKQAVVNDYVIFRLKLLKNPKSKSQAQTYLFVMGIVGSRNRVCCIMKGSDCSHECCMLIAIIGKVEDCSRTGK